MGRFCLAGTEALLLIILKIPYAVCPFLHKGYLAVTDFRRGAFLPERRKGCNFAAEIEKKLTLKTISTMRTIETVKSGRNYKAVSVGNINQIIEHELPMGPNVIRGKVFVGQAVGATGSELSFQTLVPGQDSGFLHTHKTHEELYIILRGEGTYQVDGEQFPVSEGTIVRVSPDGRRALKNTGSENLTMLCIQYRANNFTEADSPMTDGNILADPLVW